jgi:hypothetical protein
MKIIITEGQLSKIIDKGILSEEKPKTEKDITDFQNFARGKGFKNVVGKDKGQLISADGSWGDNSEGAWGKYGNSYKPNLKNNQSNEYPYDVLSKNPKSKDIAEIIKKSNGGWLGNDKEAWAEAAFNKIINKIRYNEVSRLLGEDVYKYISNYIKTSKIYHTGPSIYDTYQKLFGKVQVNTLKKPKTHDEIINFQNFAKSKGFKNVFGRNKGKLITADGSWGRNSEAAWNMHSSTYNPSDVKTDNENKVKAGDTSWLKSASKQVKNQISYLMKQGFSKPFTVLDDINSKVYAVNGDYSIYGVYKVITGKDKGDEVKDVTFGDWYRENPLDNTWQFLKDIYTSKKSLKDKVVNGKVVPGSVSDAVSNLDNEYFHGTKLWVTMNTPSGIFKADASPMNWLESKVMTKFAEKDYGKRFIGFKTLSGKAIAVGFHGTKNDERIDIDKDDWKQAVKNKGGNYSFGCINFKDADIQSISNFITNDQYSFWLPDTSTNYVQFKQGEEPSFIRDIIRSIT